MDQSNESIKKIWFCCLIISVFLLHVKTSSGSGQEYSCF